jgi:hypothetical protein
MPLQENSALSGIVFYSREIGFKHFNICILGNVKFSTPFTHALNALRSMTIIFHSYLIPAHCSDRGNYASKTFNFNDYDPLFSLGNSTGKFSVRFKS